MHDIDAETQRAAEAQYQMIGAEYDVVKEDIEDLVGDSDVRKAALNALATSRRLAQAAVIVGAAKCDSCAEKCEAYKTLVASLGL